MPAQVDEGPVGAELASKVGHFRIERECLIRAGVRGPAIALAVSGQAHSLGTEFLPELAFQGAGEFLLPPQIHNVYLLLCWLSGG